MRTNVLSVHVVVALTVVVGAACAHAKAAPEPSASTDTTRSDSRQQIQASAAPVAKDASLDDQQAQKDLEAAIADLRNSRIFFGTDDDTLTPTGRTKLAAVGDILAKHPNLHVRVEGNCDERGTEAYNLVLGQRRADVARKYVLSMGAQEGQVGTVSYGKERPLTDGHTENAWKQNRRADVVVDQGRN